MTDIDPRAAQAQLDRTAQKIRRWTLERVDEVLHAKKPDLTFCIEGNGDTLVDGYYGPILLSYSRRITGAYLRTFDDNGDDVSATVTVDIEISPTSGGAWTSLPDTGTLPSLSGSASYSDNALTNWITTIEADATPQWMRFLLTDCDTLTKLAIGLRNKNLERTA